MCCLRARLIGSMRCNHEGSRCQRPRWRLVRGNAPPPCLAHTALFFRSIISALIGIDVIIRATVIVAVCPRLTCLSCLGTCPAAHAHTALIFRNIDSAVLRVVVIPRATVPIGVSPRGIRHARGGGRRGRRRRRRSSGGGRRGRRRRRRSSGKLSQHGNPCLHKSRKHT